MPHEPLTDSEAHELIYEIATKGEYPAHEWLVKLAEWSRAKAERVDELEEALRARRAA